MPLIKTVELSKTYRMDETYIQALDNINLSIEQGEFVAITGPSGSGKSTLLHILGCIDTPTSGKVFIKDMEVNKMSGRAREVSGFMNSGSYSSIFIFCQPCLRMKISNFPFRKLAFQRKCEIIVSVSYWKR